MASFIDRFLKENPVLSKVLRNFADNIFSISVRQQIALCVMATLASGYYYYEKLVFYANNVRPLLSVLMIGTWIFCSFWSGFRRQSLFAVFSVLYWSVPNAVMYLYAKGVGRSNLIMHTADRVSSLLVSSPLMYISGRTGASAFECAAAMLAVTEILFVLGFVFRRKCRRSSWYCRYRGKVRHKHSGGSYDN